MSCNLCSYLYIAKDEAISKVLKSLENTPEIILKGGTAVNRVYTKNKRFSEDIDLDLICPEKNAISKTKEIMRKI